VSNNDEIENLRADFEEMQKAGMFPEKPPSFLELIMSIQELEKVINNN